jgi:hypothetical protein
MKNTRCTNARDAYNIVLFDDMVSAFREHPLDFYI